MSSLVRTCVANAVRGRSQREFLEELCRLELSGVDIGAKLHSASFAKSEPRENKFAVFVFCRCFFAVPSLCRTFHAVGFRSVAAIAAASVAVAVGVPFSFTSSY
jgi:hypothetical protein